MDKAHNMEPDYHSTTKEKLVHALIDSEIENALLARKYEKLLREPTVAKVDLTDAERHKLIYSLKSHNPPHLHPQKNGLSVGRGSYRNLFFILTRKSVLRLISAYILVFVSVYYVVWLITS
jgi:hypothetical protein